MTEARGALHGAMQWMPFLVLEILGTPCMRDIPYQVIILFPTMLTSNRLTERVSSTDDAWTYRSLLLSKTSTNALIVNLDTLSPTNPFPIKLRF